jgi:hypothetical protein
MVQRKKWTVQEEAQLKALIESNENVEEIAAKLKKTPGAVIVKSQRLGLQLQVKGYINTSISLPKELPSIEETTKIMAGVMRASVRPGLNKLEMQRLQMIANVCEKYKELAADFAHYREIEIRLKKMEEENAQLRQTLKEIKERS